MILKTNFIVNILLDTLKLQNMKNLKLLSILIFLSFLLTACNGKLPGADARKVPTNPADRVAKNLEEGKGFRLSDTMKGQGSGNFEFASSNELWRASLDTISFMPLASANYSGGILITDWYSNNSAESESIKITIRFLTNEIRSDALDLKVFYKKCTDINKCIITERSGNISDELKKEILKKAAIYKKQGEDKNFKPYKRSFDPTAK